MSTTSLLHLGVSLRRGEDRRQTRIRNRYAALHAVRLEPGQSVAMPDAPFAHVYVTRGQMHRLKRKACSTPGTRHASPLPESAASVRPTLARS